MAVGKTVAVGVGFGVLVGTGVFVGSTVGVDVGIGTAVAVGEGTPFCELNATMLKISTVKLLPYQNRVCRVPTLALGLSPVKCASGISTVCDPLSPFCP